MYAAYQDLGDAAVQDGVWRRLERRPWRGREVVVRPAPGLWPGHALHVVDHPGQLAGWPRSSRIPDWPLNSPSAPPGPLNGSLGANLGSGNPGVTAAVDGLTVTVDGDRQIFDFDAIFAPDAPRGSRRRRVTASST